MKKQIDFKGGLDESIFTVALKYLENNEFGEIDKDLFWNEVMQ